MGPASQLWLCRDTGYQNCTLFEQTEWATKPMRDLGKVWFNDSLTSLFVRGR